MAGEGDREEEELRVKVLLLGEPGAGKTSLRDRLCQHYFNPFWVKTVGVQFSRRKFLAPLDDQLQRFHVCFWDMGGDQPHCEAIAPFYKNAMAIVYVFDLTNMESLRGLPEWKKRAGEFCNGKKVVTILVGTKRDLKYLREVGEAAAKEMGQRLGADHYAEVSALEERGGVEEAMVELFTSVSHEFRFGIKRPIRLTKEPTYYRSCI